MRHNFTFIDLFAGIGGFHQAMRYLGGECVMASEIDAACVNTYKTNFPNVDVRGDIRKINPQDIPSFDVLCAGFPCQPFSKAGYRDGFNDRRGTLFHSIIDILNAHPEAKFIILENVRNLADNKEYWDVIQTELMKCNFFITETPIILSPSDFGIPQTRERVYILGIRKDLRDEQILTNGYIHTSDLQIDKFKKSCTLSSGKSILENNVAEDYILSEETSLLLDAWDEFKQETKIRTLGFPIWVDFFGIGFDDTETFLSSVDFGSMPTWKKNFVRNNRKLYLDNKEFIDSWVKKYQIESKIKLFKKFEWNCGEDCKSIREGIIQIRQSGIRVKRPNFFPSLVAMVNTPIIWDERISKYRHITTREAANLQSFHARYKFIGEKKQIYRQLGNSVNVRLLKILGEQLFALAKQNWDSENA